MDSNLLAVRAGAGDIAAFEELVRLHQNQVFSIALRMSGNREDALDISQETFVRVWRALPQFNSESKFSTWLYRIVSNICTDFYRKNSRMQTVSITTSYDEGEDTQLELPDEKHSPERSVENDELSDALERAINELKPEWKTVFVMREISDMSYSEIAEALEIEEGTVKSRLFRARRQLQEILKISGNIPSTRPSKDVKDGDAR